MDLQSRGMLDDTLVVWMGEFGRTPKVNGQGGRDHFARAWTSVLFGGGVRGGQIIGRTDPTGGTVVERPISALDFLATICTILGLSPDHEHIVAGNRPVRVVDKGYNLIREVL
jgi:arylsulfatase A-like enzyme